MKIKVLASGSTGNAYILETPTGKLLIEAGIVWEKLLQGFNFNLNGIVGCLVSHEHLDHAKALSDVLDTGIDCYTSKGTADALGLERFNLHHVASGNQFDTGDFTILPFRAEHDAREPLGFLIQYNPEQYKVLFLTDSYYCKYKFRGLNTIMVECNYVKETLDYNIEQGYIPESMKNRLLESHFSLENVKKFLQANDLSDCNNIMLLHLSNSNSDAKRMVKEIHEQTMIEPIVADKGVEIELSKYPF